MVARQRKAEHALPISFKASASVHPCRCFIWQASHGGNTGTAGGHTHSGSTSANGDHTHGATTAGSKVGQAGSSGTLYRGLATQYGVDPDRTTYLPEVPVAPKVGRDRMRPDTVGGSGTGIPSGARRAPDGKLYVPDPNRLGKYLEVR